MEVTLIDSMGSDLSVVNAARVSFAKESEWEWEESGVKSPFTGESYQKLSDKDAKLISYLAKHNHWSPFGHTAITLHIKAPIFIARQLGKHQVGLVWNEVSRRYVDDTPEFYRFDSYRLKAPNVKQGSSDKTFVPKGQSGRCPQCGLEFVAKGNRTIYCSSQCQAKAYRSTPDGWRITKVSRLQQSAKKRGIEFSITKEDIPTPEKCPYLGIPLKYDNDGLQGDSASVDRIDNVLGYVPGNIQTVSNKANTMKSVATDDELVTFSKNALLMHGGFMVPQVDSLDLYHEEMKRLYNHLISEGMAPEQARGFMPQTLFTEWYWTGNLYAFANVYNKRIDPHAQKEVQEVAKQIGEVIAPLFPVSWEALTK